MGNGTGTKTVFLIAAGFLALSGLLAPPAEGDGAKPESSPGGAQAADHGSGGPPGAGGDQGTSLGRVVREGGVIEFSLEPAGKKGAERNGILEGEYADVKFRVTDEAKGQPLRGLWPGGGVGISKTVEEKGGPSITCREKVGLYLRGLVGIRPMIDLSGYFLLSLNRDPGISVIDPLVGISGRTSLYATVPLEKPGADWVKSRDEKRLYVSMPQAGRVAVVDPDAFRVIRNVDAGENPVRVALQPDGEFLWVGNDGKYEQEGGVTVIRAATFEVVGSISTGKGHHEIAFSPDSRFAYVSNRSDGTVSVIDVQARKKVRDVQTGPMPISLDYSRLSQSLYVADGKEGTIAVVDGKRHDVAERIRVKQGLGPLRFTPDGRWGFALNTREGIVYVIDSATNGVAYALPVGSRPYQIALTRNFAHVRCLGTARVTMINLSELGKESPPPVNSYAVGAGAPELASGLGIANAISAGAGEAEVMVVNPVNNNIYYYMEGMNAPMGSFQGYGKNPQGVMVVNRSLRETEPGVYSARVRVPTAGSYDVAFILDSPRIVHCFSVTAKADPEKKRSRSGFEVEYLLKERKVKVGREGPLRFRVLDPETRGPLSGLQGLSVLYYVAPGVRKTRVPVREVGEGIYEAMLSIPLPGAYYVYAVPAMRNVKYSDLSFVTLVAEEENAAPKGRDPEEGK